MKQLLSILVFLPLLLKGQEYIIDPAFNDLEDRYRVEVLDLFYEEIDNSLLVVGDFNSNWQNWVPPIDKLNPNGFPDLDWFPEDLQTIDELSRIHRVSDGYRTSNSSNMPHYDFEGTRLEGTDINYGEWLPIGSTYGPYIAEGDTIYIPGLFRLEMGDEFLYRQCLKFYPDGTLDNSFIPSECTLSTSPFPPSGGGFLKYDNNRLIFTSSMDSINGHRTIKVARMYMDGRIDTTFVSEISPEGGLAALHVDNQGRILVTMSPRSDFFVSDSTEVFRLMPDGSLDPSWTPIDLGYRPNLSVGSLRTKAIIPMEDGGYILGGWFNYVNGIRRTSIVKVDSTGALDESLFNNEPFSVDYENFPYNWYLNDTIPEINVLMRTDDGGILVGGRFTHYGETIRRSLVKLILDETIGVDDQDNTLKTSIYPNPNSGTFTLSLTDQSSLGELKVYDLAGRSLPYILNRKNSKEWEVSLSAPSGLYILKLMDENGNLSSAKVHIE